MNNTIDAQRYLDAIEAAKVAIEKNRPRRWLARYNLTTTSPYLLPSDLKILDKEYKAIKKEIEAMMPKYQSGEQLTIYKVML